MKQSGEFCPLDIEDGPCRHCSDEVQKEVVRFGVIRDCEFGKAGQMGQKTRRIELGKFCNNDGRRYVKDLKVCPKKDALSVPLNHELHWMKRRARKGTI